MFLRVMVLALFGQISLIEMSADDSIKPWLTIFGKPLEALELPKDSQFGFSYNHLSNASLGKKNPGANSYMFNFLKKF